MKIVIQRVAEASVQTEGQTVASIGRGLLILVGVVPADTQADIELLARKSVAMRIFDDPDGVMNLSVRDIGGEILAVSQFTLAASIRKGNRPSYVGAAGHDIALPAYLEFCAALERHLGREVKRGVFGADMKVSLVNDGPVTIVADSANLV